MSSTPTPKYLKNPTKLLSKPPSFPPPAPTPPPAAPHRQKIYIVLGERRNEPREPIHTTVISAWSTEFSAFSAAERLAYYEDEWEPETENQMGYPEWMRGEGEVVWDSSEELVEREMLEMCEEDWDRVYVVRLVLRVGEDGPDVEVEDEGNDDDDDDDDDDDEGEGKAGQAADDTPSKPPREKHKRLHSTAEQEGKEKKTKLKKWE
ncbi:hypothetical protein K490DRAFT_69851 [Saccharata proteae CBS 121410]|uniref:Uncharacterized protein n=1 Tax=Saccharata proteae CBS 121410 TaxID=1314787 RepID=A0A9P4HPT1_9PEZI|nr:hypothetical protein K490DRAFT_69851 [Saccharata proteae CBS 121410]